MQRHLFYSNHGAKKPLVREIGQQLTSTGSYYPFEETVELRSKQLKICLSIACLVILHCTCTLCGGQVRRWASAITILNYFENTFH